MADRPRSSGPQGSGHDFQSWNQVDLAASWRNVDFLVPLLARADTRLPNPQLAATGIAADFPLPSHLTLAAGYLFADLPPSSLAVHLPAPIEMQRTPTITVVALFLVHGPERVKLPCVGRASPQLVADSDDI